MYPYQTS